MKISKTFSRKISKDYCSWEFATSIEQDIPDPKTKEELIEQSDKLFSKVRALTVHDIQKVEAEIGPLPMPSLPPKKEIV